MRVRDLFTRRAAPFPTYGSGLSRGWTVVPSLTFRSRRPKGLPETVGSSPIMLPPLWRVATTMASIGIKVYRIDAEGEREDAHDHPAYQLLRRPNPMLTRRDLVGGTVLSMFVHQKAIWEKVRVGGSEPVELWPLPADQCEVLRDPRSLYSKVKLSVPGEPPQFIPFSDVLYFRLLPSPIDWADGFSPLAAMGDATDMSGDALGALKTLFREGVFERRYVDTHGKIVSPEAQARFEASWQRARGDPSKMPFVEDDFTIESMGDGPDDEQMLRGVELGSKLLQQALGVDDDTAKFYMQAIAPVADAIEQELERALMIEWSDDPAFAEFSFRELLKGTPKERVELHQTAILSAQEKPNEARRDENRPPVGGGDVLFIPLNEVPIGQAGQPDGVTPKDTTGGLGGDQGKGTLPATPSAQMRSRSRLTDAHRSRWAAGRKALLIRQQDALGRRAAQILGREQTAVGSLFEVQARVAIPTMAELLAVLGRSNRELRDLLRASLDQVGKAGWERAQELISAGQREVSDAVQSMVRERAAVAASVFGTRRVGAMEQLIEQVRGETRPRDAAQLISDAYRGMQTYFADGIARTEVALIHEQAAKMQWQQAGVSQLEFVFGGGPCTEGVCEEAAADSVGDIGRGLPNVGYSLEFADTPPLHPNCTCFVVPYVAGG